MALDVLFDFLADHQDLVRLIMWDGLEGGETSRSIWDEIRGPLFLQMEALLKKAQAQGTLRPELDPAHLIISILGATTFYFAYAPTLFEMVHGDPLSPEGLKKRKEQMQRFIEALYVPTQSA